MEYALAVYVLGLLIALFVAMVNEDKYLAIVSPIWPLAYVVICLEIWKAKLRGDI